MSKSTWNSDADQDFLFSIIMGDEVSRPSPNWEKVTAVMQELGYSFTKEAIRQHFAKRLWAPFEERRTGGTDPSTPSPTKKIKKMPTSSQKKRKQPVTPRASASKRPKPAIDEEDGEEYFEVVTPTKKPKIEAPVKMESTDSFEY